MLRTSRLGEHRARGLAAVAVEVHIFGMPLSRTSPKHHAFVAVFSETGSAVQGSGPTREAALEEAARGLGSDEGLEVYPTGPRLAAMLALGDYEMTTPFGIERRLDLPHPRAELRLSGQVDEARADVRVAYASGRGQWAGREWDDSDRVCPDWTDAQIVRAFEQNDGRLDVTAWGIPDDGSYAAQQWRSAVRTALAALAAGVKGPPGLPLVEEACHTLRALAETSDTGVKAKAAEAEEAAADAYKAALAGEADEAVEQAERAAAIERAFGDDPTWGPLLAAVRAWAGALHDAEDEAA